MYENRHYVIFSINEINKINFDEILETSVETLRTSVDGSMTFVKWDGYIPMFLQNLNTLQGIYTHQEMGGILLTPEWLETQIQH